jgi:hypothetical protein
MTIHYSIAAELGRQRQQQIAAGIRACRPLTRPRRRWWEEGFLRRPSTTGPELSPVPGRVPATA